MPFDRPTLTQRRDDALQDIAASRILDTVTGSVVDATMLQTSPLRSLAYAAAAAAYEEDGYIDWLALQANPWTATGEWAVAWGGLVGVGQKQATAATGTRVLTGIIGTDIPAGTQFSRADGFTYATTADAVLNSFGVATVTLRANVVGAAGNAPVGTALSLTLTIPGTSVTNAGASAITGGADIEAFAAFKARYLARYANPPQGGDAADYIDWALDVAGVTRAWINPVGAGAGTVVLYTMFDLANAAYAGFPQGVNGVATAETRDTKATGDQLTVANAIYPLRPVTALVYSVSPISYPVAFTFVTRAAVSSSVMALASAALDQVFIDKADPLGGNLPISPFETAVAAVPGMPDFTLTGPAVAITPPLGHLPVRGALTWTVSG